MAKKIQQPVALILLLVAVFVLTPAAFADVSTDAATSFTANEEQLVVLNELYHQNPNISHGAVLQVIAPDFWAGLSEMQKTALLDSYFAEIPTTSTRGAGVDAVSTLTTYGASLKFTSSHTTDRDSYEYEMVIARIKNMDTNQFYGYAIDSCDYENPKSVLSASDVIDPPTGNYRAYGNHFVYQDLFNGGKEFVSQSSTRSYVNPYE